MSGTMRRFTVAFLYPGLGRGGPPPLEGLRFGVLMGRSLALELFERLQSPRKRPIARRQLAILNHLLEHGPQDIPQLIKGTDTGYSGLKNPLKGLIRDVNHLMGLKAISATRSTAGAWELAARLEWPMEITETEFFRSVKNLPKAKTLSFGH